MHSARIVEPPVRRLDPTPRALALAGPLLIALGGVVFVLALLVDADRAWRAYLVNWLWSTSIAQGAVMFAVVVTITKGLWSRTSRRFMLAFVAYLPISFLLMLPVLLVGADSILPWIEHPVAGKEAYLNRPFMIVRQLLGVGALFALSVYFAYVMLRPDLGRLRDRETGRTRDLYHRLTKGWLGEGPEDLRAHHKLTKLAPAMVIAYALGFTLISWDWVMSLDPHWFSTLIGPYFFMGAFLGGVAATALSMVLYGRNPDYGSVLPGNHFHDVGKLLFGFCIFWAYMFFSQYIVIWYGKLPVEQTFLVDRLSGPFRVTSIIVFLSLFVVPFAGLLSVTSKKRSGLLATFAIIVMAGLWLERFTLVYPSIYHGTDTLPLGWMELGMMPLFLGFVLLSVAFFAKRYPMFQLWVPLSEAELMGVEREVHFDAGMPEGEADTQ